MQVTTGNFRHRWLGCILGVDRASRSALDLQQFFFTHTNACDQRVVCVFSTLLLLLLLCQVLGTAVFIVPHGRIIPQAALYGGGNSGQSGLVGSLARDFARMEHEGSDARK